MRKIFICICLFTSSLFAGKYWNADPGSVTMKFLASEVSPRSASLAGAGVAMSGSLLDASRNPLALASLQNPSVGVSQVIYSKAIDARLNSILWGNPFQSFNMLAGLEFLNYGDIEGRDEEGFKTGNYGASAWGAQLAFSNKKEAFHWALSYKLASQNIEDYTAYAFLGDFGLSLDLNSYFSLGSLIRNLGYVTSYRSHSEALPLSLQAGLAFHMPIGSIFELKLYSDLYRRADSKAEVFFASELIYKNTLSLRGGYALKKDTKNGINAGLGLKFDVFSVDYAFQANPNLDGNHLLSIILSF